MSVPLRYRLLNALRRLAEDYRAPERSRVEDMHALFALPVIRRQPGRVLSINLLVRRGQRKVA